MQLRIKPTFKNSAPLLALLIKGASLFDWLKEVENIGWSIHTIDIYPVPSQVANVTWGCVVVSNKEITKETAGRHQRLQLLFEKLFIIEHAQLIPSITPDEAQRLFDNKLHLLHPTIGLVELNHKINLDHYIVPPELQSYYVTEPEPSILIPQKIKTYYIKPPKDEDPLEALTKATGKNEKVKDKPLNIAEKTKLLLYKSLFKKGESGEVKEKSGLGKAIAPLFNFLGTGDKLMDKISEDHDQLEERNKKSVNKLLDMLEKNPEEALKYAIPIDQSGSGRGGMYEGAFNLSQIWDNFSFLGGDGSGGIINLGSGGDRLADQYYKTAEQLIEKGDYKRAAFVYYKLLQDKYRAAETLEKGKLYKEAAAVYSKQLNNLDKAAECFEKGNMLQEAIDHYSKIPNDIKVGDLYIKMHKKQAAMNSYNTATEKLKQNRRFYDAAALERDRMLNVDRAQATLLEAWNLDIEPSKCLQKYLSNITDDKKRLNAIKSLHDNTLTDRNTAIFVSALKHEYVQKNENQEIIKELVYITIADRIDRLPHLVSELKSFNKNDKELIKDTIRFKSLSNRKRNWT